MEKRKLLAKARSPYHGEQKGFISKFPSADQEITWLNVTFLGVGTAVKLSIKFRLTDLGS